MRLIDTHTEQERRMRVYVGLGWVGVALLLCNMFVHHTEYVTAVENTMNRHPLAHKNSYSLRSNVLMLQK